MLSLFFHRIGERFRSDIARVRAHRAPTPWQVFGFWAIFSRRERIVFLVFGVGALVSGIVWTHIFFQTHVTTIPARGGSYTEGVLEEPRNVNPIFASNDVERGISNLLFRSLFTYNARNELIPDAADHIDISDDGKTYTITLKKNLVWQDGKPFTVDDVLFTIAMIQNPDYHSPLRQNWQGVTAEKSGDSTLLLHLRQPYAPFIQNVTVGIMPQHIWATIRPENSAQADYNIKPVGSGPYQFEKLSRSTTGSILSYSIARADTAGDNGPPFINEMTFRVFSSEELMLSAYQRGMIDGMNFLSAEHTDTIQKSTGTLYSTELPQIFAVFFNQSKNQILSDSRVREALDAAIDRDALIQTVFRGGAKPISGPLPSGGLGIADTEPAPFDPSRARRILEDAGWKKNPDTGLFERVVKGTTKGSSKTETLHITLTTSQWPDLVETAKFIKRSWDALGVDVTLQVAAIPDLDHQYIQPRNYEALLFGEGFGRDLDPFAFWHSTQVRAPGLNLSLYVNKKVDTLLESARRTSDQIDIVRKYTEFQDIVAKDHPAIFLYTPEYFFVMRNTIHGVDASGMNKPSDRFFHADDWYMNTTWKFK